MGFIKDAANVATFGLVGNALSKKKKSATTTPQPTMITSMAARPTSMIGSTRGGY